MNHYKIPVNYYKYGRQNFLYQKAVLEGLCKLYFNKKIVCPNPFWAYAFVSGLCFCRTCLSYKNQVFFCRELSFLVMQFFLGIFSRFFLGIFSRFLRFDGFDWYLQRFAAKLSDLHGVVVVAVVGWMVG